MEQSDDPDERRRLLGRYFTQKFHAYWSDFSAAFITSAMDVGTELNAAEPVMLSWYTAAPKSTLHPHDVQGLDRSLDKLSAVFLCSVCNEENNVCLFDGVCVNGMCECGIGSYGSLCQVRDLDSIGSF